MLSLGKKEKAVGLCLLFLSLSSYSSELDSKLKKEARAYRNKGYELQTRGNYQEALSFYTKAINLDPSYKEAYNDLGVIYETLGDLDQAEKMYLKAIQIDEDYLAPYTNLGFLYEKKKDFSRAAYYWKKRYLLGREGEYWREEARRHLAQISPQELKKLNADLLARKLLMERKKKRQEDLEKAKFYFKNALNFLAKAHYEDAQKELEKAVSLNIEDKELARQINDYYRKTLEYIFVNNAEKHLQNALNYLKMKDYLSVMQELRRVVAIIPEIPKE